MLPFALGLLVTLFLWDSLLIGVVALPHASRPSSHVRKRWYHDQDHPVHTLFKRQDPSSYPPVGSSEWKSSFPDPSNFPPRTLPKAWTDALNASVAAGKIPNIPISTLTGGGSITYPSGSGSPTGPTICSAYYECRAKGDLWDAPTGQVALAFDDGPLPTSPPLYNFTKSKQQPVTHFFIGGNIYLNWKIFLQAFQDNQDDIAVHTYTHPHMTTLSNERVLAELGYTMQIMHDSTGGRVPRFWRPPYGDCDNRVRAIAREIFGLTTVVWNHDTSDWQLSDGTISYTQVQNSLKSFYSSPKSPGLIILEHELSALSVQAFIWSWPLIGKNGWTPVTIADAAGGDWYRNSHNDTASLTQMGILPGTTVPGGGTSTAISGSTSGGSLTTGPGGTSGGSVPSTTVTRSSSRPSGAATTIRPFMYTTMSVHPVLFVFFSAAFGGLLACWSL